MATSLSLENDSSLAQGYIKVNGSTAATLTTSGITGNLTGNVTGSLTQGGSLTLGTAQTASGTAVDFTGIPSWAKRITVMFDGVSTNAIGSAVPSIQIGDSGGIENTGYASYANYIGSNGSVGATTSTTMFLTRAGGTLNSDTLYGHGVLTLLNSNTWVFSFNGGMFSGINYTTNGGGSKTLSGTLDRIRITTTNGTDTFDAGTINIMFEG